MEQTKIVQRIINLDVHLMTSIEAFLIDRQAQGLTKRSVEYYKCKLGKFMRFCDNQLITSILEIQPHTIREFILMLQATGHNPGGCHSFYRAIKTFLFWWENEVEPENWRNPIRKVKAPKVPSEPIQPVPMETIKQLLDECKRGTFNGDRDYAIFLTLLDTGARATEFLSMDCEDLNLMDGSILIRSGKGRKPRFVFLGKKSKRYMRKYLKHRNDSNAALWVTNQGDRLTYSGLRMMIKRKTDNIGVPEIPIHDFRRLFALTFLRNNPGEIYSLQRLMGHSDLQMLRRYLAQTDGDIKKAHMRGSPVDNMIW